MDRACEALISLLLPLSAVGVAAWIGWQCGGGPQPAFTVPALQLETVGADIALALQ